MVAEVADEMAVAGKVAAEEAMEEEGRQWSGQRQRRRRQQR